MYILLNNQEMLCDGNTLIEHSISLRMNIETTFANLKYYIEFDKKIFDKYNNYKNN